MATIPVKVKHAGKVYEVDVDTNSTGEDLMLQLYSLTNVEPQNQKISAGKMIKNDTSLSTIKLKPGQSILLLGKPSADVAIEAPKQQIKFIEDMTDAEIARSEGAIPAGLSNTGNTCYANATLQTLRIIPELQDVLKTYKPSEGNAAPVAESSLFSAEQLAQVGLRGLGGANDLTSSLRDVYGLMAETQGAVQPIMFLTALRQKFPQFAEQSKDGRGYAQQDAEEMWSQLVSTLHQNLKVTEGEKTAAGFQSWVEQYMGGQLESVTKCDEAPEEEAVTKSEGFHDLKCNISGETNHLREGIMTGLDEKIEKRSPTLGRDAMYTKTSRITRLPKYLPIHFVRFFWRRDTSKKAKILRKVTFQHEIDALEFCADSLREKLVPIRDAIREVRKEEEDIERAKKKRKRNAQEQEEAARTGGKVLTDEPLQKRKEKEDKKNADGDTEMTNGESEVFKTDAERDAEAVASVKAAKEKLLSLVSPEMAKDSTANQTGLYELRGLITHQGASADSGHYTAYVKKTAPPGKAEDGKWWWFNDDKVSEVEHEKIETLSGGGETHSALILLYRAVQLPTVEGQDGA
ncbi:hypothetical protein AMS68_005485 [Peltaster fructicola]|uniref:Ubiquitin carboxyl-terminal hydrolase n=1 Tax=Peltaster fructicola TaxID=286661 RepID=A0A6H0XZF0_9PEZI|nr:hypothetical protein AMS68_005485 [Peltaster fructicola]